MLKLAAYSALTALAVYLGLAGGPDAVGPSAAKTLGAAHAGSPVVPVTEPDPVVVETTSAPPVDGKHADDKTEVKAQPAPVLMPRPRLKRSPEFAWRDAQGGAVAAPAAPADAAVMYVTAPTVNLRAGPSTQNAVVGKLGAGDAVTLTAPAENGWVAVLLSDGATRGYLSAKFLSADKP